MTVLRKLSAFVEWLDRHPIRKLLAYLVAAALGISALIAAFVLVRDTFFKAEPDPQIISAQAPEETDLAFDPSLRQVEVVVENPTDRALVITGVAVRTEPFPPGYVEEASSPILPSKTYKLPLNCKSENGSSPIHPAYQVDPKSAAAFILQGDTHKMDCMVFLTFETNQGSTEEKLAEGF